MIDFPNLFHDKVAKAMIAIALGKSKWKEKIENDLEMKHVEEKMKYIEEKMLRKCGRCKSHLAVFN